MIHVVDASDPRVNGKMGAVELILKDLNVEEVPRLVVINKCDAPSLVSPAPAGHGRGHGERGEARGMEALVTRVEDVLFAERAGSVEQALSPGSPP